MSTEIIGSNFPTEASDQLMPAWSKGSQERLLGATHINGYGQNQFGGPSSLTPGQSAKSGFLPDPSTPVNSQLRKVKADPLPTTFGMKKPNPNSL